MLTLKVIDETGRSRFFQFVSEEVRVGFRTGADVALEPVDSHGGELLLQITPGGQCRADPIAAAGSFSIGGRPIKDSVPVKAGDVITGGPCQIHVQEIEGAETMPSDPIDTGVADLDQTFVDSDSGVPVKSDPSPKSASSQVPDDGDSYLVLFFEPIRQFLEDDDVSEIMINGPDEIFIEKKGKLEDTEARFINEQALQAAVKNVARSIGRFFNTENPRLDARFPDGSRVHAVIPPLSRKGTTVAIRKFSKEKLTMPQLVSFGSASEECAGLIEAVVRSHQNVIVSGPTSSGKTSVLNVLSSFIDTTERILVIEDASELQLQQKHTVYFETRKPDEHGKGEVPIRDLVTSSLRLRPDRLIVGEIRAGESLDMLQAMNTGHSGSMSTIHANSPVDALSRIETCALLSGIDIPLSAIRSQVASAINVVVHTARLSDGSRKITNVSEVLPLEDGEYRCQDLIRFEAEGMDDNGKLRGQHVGAGVLPTFFEEAKLRGITIEEDWFKAPGS